MLTCKNAYEGTAKLTEYVSQHFSGLAESATGHSDGDRRVHMTSCEWGGRSDAKVQETADEECPVRIGYHFRCGDKVLGGIDPVSKKESAYGFEDEDSHALTSE